MEPVDEPKKNQLSALRAHPPPRGQAAAFQGSRRKLGCTMRRPSWTPLDVASTSGAMACEESHLESCTCRKKCGKRQGRGGDDGQQGPFYAPCENGQPLGPFAPPQEFCGVGNVKREGTLARAYSQESLATGCLQTLNVSQHADALGSLSRSLSVQAICLSSRLVHQNPLDSQFIAHEQCIPRYLRILQSPHEYTRNYHACDHKNYIHDNAWRASSVSTKYSNKR